jgi:hypothetical protein
MGVKLDKGTYPASSGPNDFQCFGPAATKDGEFDTVKIADLGCFTQDGKDSNKYYHAAIVQHKTTKKWYVYFEWGRTGASKPSFQFVECSSEADAQREFADQLHDKNDKRGQWVTVAGVRTLQAKPKKDCYLVRPLAQRSTGLPDAKTIKCGDGAKVKPVDNKAPGAVVKKAPTADANTLKLMRDLNVATVSYTRGSMADSSLPTQTAIDEGRNLLQEAQKRLIVVGDNVDAQVADRDLVQITTVLYSRIPKKKPLHCPPQDWILSKNNVLLWTSDLDAFEAALAVSDAGEQTQDDPFAGMPLQMSWIDPTSALGKFLYAWWPRATANRHGGLGTMKIKNMWQVDRHGDQAKLQVAQDTVLGGKHRITERPLFQPPERHDLGDNTLMKRYADSNTGLLFHGTRSVNVTGILRESFRLPKQLVGVVITGAMFGGGVYFADDWKKSAGYTSLHGGYYSSGAGGVRGRDAFMFACDVVCGNPHVAPGPRGYTEPPKGCHSIFGKGGVSQVQNNEWIVFSTQQSRLRYLAEFAA